MPRSDVAAPHERFAFSARIAPADLVDRVVLRIAPAPQLLRFRARIVVLDVDATGITFGYGTRAWIGWRSRLTVAPAGSGTRAQYLVLAWGDRAAVRTPSLDAMRRLANAVREVAAALGAELGPADVARRPPSRRTSSSPSTDRRDAARLLLDRPSHSPAVPFAMSAPPRTPIAGGPAPDAVPEAGSGLATNRTCGACGAATSGPRCGRCGGTP